MAHVGTSEFPTDAEALAASWHIRVYSKTLQVRVCPGALAPESPSQRYLAESLSQRYLASKEIPNCEVDGMTSLNIDT